jgi:hypothetical protein
MSFLWDVFDRVTNLIGQEGALLCFAVAGAVLAYLVLGSPTANR